MAAPLDSPLEKQAPPVEPLVVGLYRRLFRDSEVDERDDEFWQTLFLLKPDKATLRQVIEETEADTLLHAQVRLLVKVNDLPLSLGSIYHSSFSCMPLRRSKVARPQHRNMLSKL